MTAIICSMYVLCTDEMRRSMNFTASITITEFRYPHIALSNASPLHNRWLQLLC